MGLIVHQLSVLTTSMIGTQRYTGIGFRSWAIWVDGEMSARNFSSLVEDRIIKRFLHSDGRFYASADNFSSFSGIVSS